MTITLFGIIWIVLLIYSFYKTRIQFLISLTLLSMIFQCTNVIELNNQGIGPQLITSITFIIRSIFISQRQATKQKYPYLIASLFLFVIYILFNSIYNGLLSNNTANIIQILLYLLCAIRLHKYRNIIDEQELITQVLFIIKFILIFSPVQYLATKGVIPREFLVPLFFNDMGENVYFHYPDRYQRLLGTFLEPSFCAPFLVGSFFFILHMQKRIKNAKSILILIIIELILTKSSTGYGTFFIIFIIYILACGNKKHFKYIIPIFLIGAIFYYLTKDNLLQEVIFSKMESDSGKFRGQQDFNAIYLFLSNPVTGSGLGSSRASSLITTLLAELGIVGITLYAITFFASSYPLINQQKYTQLEISSRLFILSIIFSQLIAIPDLQYCVYWLSLYIIALSQCTPSNISNKRSQTTLLKKTNALQC